MISFGCGCVDPVKLDQDLEFLRQYLTFDAQGFVICPVHRQRRSDWRSVPYTATKRPAGLPADMTEYEYERWILFSIKPRRGTTDETTGTDGLADIRDNRPAVDLGTATLERLKALREINASATASEAADLVV